MLGRNDENGTFLPGPRAAAPSALAQGRAWIDTEESKQKKGSITEEDVCTLLQRYSAATILALFKEMAQVVDVKLDWQELVKKTDTGIKSAREYQMLWRHLAYRQPLIEKIDPEDQPLDDDSDLEYELEACPPASTGDALEASNCVKILTSRSSNKSRLPNSTSVEVPRVSSAVPSVHKQSQLSQAAGTSCEGLNANGPTSNNHRKRKQSSEEEDRELIAPVAVSKGEFKGEKNSTQRTQRTIIKKKQAAGGANTAGTPLSDAQLATRYALDMALKDTTVGNGHAGSANVAKVSAPKRNFPITKVTAPSSQPNSSPITTAPSSGKPAPMASSSKLCPQKKAPPPPPPPPPPPSSVSANSIEAAAVAAGARIIKSTDAAASLFKATQSKNAVHIKGGPPVKASAASISSSLPPNVHLMTGSSTPTTPVAAGTSSSVLSGQQPKVNVVGSTAPPVCHLPKVRVTSTVAMERSSNATTTTRVHEDVSSVSQCLPKAPLVKCQASSPDDGHGKQAADVGDSRCTMNGDIDEMEGKDVTCKPVVEGSLSRNGGEQSCAVQRNCTPPTNGTHGISPSAVSDEGAEKIEVSSERLHGDPII